ncbi:hypothetical protein SAMN05660703_2359 [Cellulophaga tyrosinoxydans]|uniref:Uncharacterized protein n=2 Tax=Cellulophaga tyrosinoxydans TaxID=504486 RepID=A0A1W2BEU6_9FLAO|nr:hypothetical protein SAMN05660703_2359 [Cellulophaga tyrosinoxydans]
MYIFNRKTNHRHIQQFEYTIAELLKYELPQLKKALDMSKIEGIYFTYKPKGISITHSYSEKDFAEINQNVKSSFVLNGISVWNKESKSFEEISLSYLNNTISWFAVQNPERFHKTFDLSQLKKGQIKLEQKEIKNSNKEKVQKLLKSLSKEQLGLLELEHTFEMELDEKLLYPILNMEDGNYIAVDNKGKIYRLNHDHEEEVRLIANKPKDFFDIYNGQKSELDKIMYD